MSKPKSNKKQLPENKFRHIHKIQAKEYTYKNNKIAVYPLSTGGYSIKIVRKSNDPNRMEHFGKLINGILDRYAYQYLVFQVRGLEDEYLDIIKKIGFIQESRGLIYQEKPKIGYWVLIAIKPYTGDYAQGYVKRILTGKGFHPRGFKVMLNDTKETVGRLAVIV